MTPNSDVLHSVLDLAETEAEVFDLAYTGTTGWCPWPKAYGGDMVAQATLAAMRSCPDKHLNSSHSYFMRPVDVKSPVRYEVEVLRDGRGFATRQVRAFQGGKPVFVMLASLAAGSAGPEFSSAMPEVPDPDSLPSAADYIAAADRPEDNPANPHHTSAAWDYWATGRSFDMRHVPGPVYFTVDGEQVPHQSVWVKAFSALPDDPALHRAALAYACDYTIIEPTLRVLGVAWADDGLMTASLDHAMWFHRDARVDEWLLYAQESVAAHDGRGLGKGRFFTRDGALVATVCQEALIRVPGA